MFSSAKIVCYIMGFEGLHTKLCFGTKVRNGLLDSTLPGNIIMKLETEEDLEAVLATVSVASFEADESQRMNESADASANTIQSASNGIETAQNDGNNESDDQLTSLQPMALPRCNICQTITDIELKVCKLCAASVHQNHPCSIFDGADIICSLCQRTKQIINECGNAKRRLEEQAERMLIASRQHFELANVGQTVVIPIPDIDRGRINARNIMAVVLEVKDGFYKLGNKDGVTKQSYVRNEIELCEQAFIAVEDVPLDKEISLREAAGCASVSGNPQGCVKCNCETKCMTNQCYCKKKNVLCNSKCHSSLSCCNK